MLAAVTAAAGLCVLLLQELQYLNLAVNNITKIQNLQRCESLQKLDLTINFIPKAGLLSIASLAGNYNLRELFLIGNPCTDWSGYRQYVLAQLPQLSKLVGGGADSSNLSSQFLQQLPLAISLRHTSMRAEYSV